MLNLFSTLCLICRLKPISRTAPDRQVQTGALQAFREDHLRPAAIAAGVLKEGESVRFGFHNLRHSLASFLVQAGTSPTTFQGPLRHADVHTTLQIYAHSRNEDRMTAQGDMLTAFFAPTATVQ
jgi:integrase